MIRIDTHKSAGSCQIHGSIRVDTDPDDSTAYQVKAKLRFLLETVEDAEAWEGILPGIKKQHEVATVEETNEKFYTASKRDRELVVGLTPQRDTEEAGDGYRGGMLVKVVRASLSKALCIVDCSIVAGGISAEEVEHVTKLLRGVVTVETENRQLPMFEEGKGKAASG